MMSSYCRGFAVIFCTASFLLLPCAASATRQKPQQAQQTSQPGAVNVALGNFVSLGPGGGGGVFAAVFHNTNPQIILAGQDVGGVSKSTDGGQTWRHVNQGGLSQPGFTQSVYVVSEIIAHPTNDDVFFVATGAGLFRSDDVGEMWTRVLPSDPAVRTEIPISWLAFSPTTPGLALAGSGSWHQPEEGFGVYRSTDDGRTFARVEAAGIPEAADIAAIAFDPANGDAFAATSAGLFKSTDNGETFTKVSFPFRHDQGQWIGIGGSAETRTFWYVLQTLGEDGSEANWSGGVYRSADGVQWEEITTVPKILEDSDELLRAMGSRIHPSNPDILLHNLRTIEAQGGTYRFDGVWTDITAGYRNTTWSADLTPDPLPVAPEALAISRSDPQRIISCNEVAILLSTDGGATFEQVSSRRLGANTHTGLGNELTFAYDLAISGNVLYTSFDDIGIWRSDDRGASWEQLTFSQQFDGGSDIRVHPSDPNRVYLSASSWSNSLREDDVTSRLLMSIDGGRTTTNITPPGTPSPLGRPALAVVFGATQQQDIIYVAFHGNSIYKSLDGGGAWQEIADGFAPGAKELVFSISVDPLNPEHLVAGLLPDLSGNNGGPFAQQGGLYQSTNGGQRWDRVSAYPFQDVSFTGFVGTPARLFASGWNVDPATGMGRGALLVSDDGGTFTEVLTQPFVYDVIAAPNSPGTLYAAASSTYILSADQNAGLYRSLDNGATWARLAGLLPHTGVLSLAIFPEEPNRILMTTLGDGVIAGTLSPSGGPVAALRIDVKANGSDGPITVALGQPLDVSVLLEPGPLDGAPADWFVAALAQSGLYWFTLDGGWQRSDASIRVLGGPLFAVPSFSLPLTGLPLEAGDYAFFFGVDSRLNDAVDFDVLEFDRADVTLR